MTMIDFYDETGCAIYQEREEYLVLKAGNILYRGTDLEQARQIAARGK